MLFIICKFEKFFKNFDFKISAYNLGELFYLTPVPFARDPGLFE